MIQKIVNKESKDSITRLRYNRNINPVAQMWLVWDSSVINYSEQKYSLSDLEIKIFHDLGEFKKF